MPLHANGTSKGKACLQGVLSGAVEPIAGFVTIIMATFIIPLMPVLLSFAAGAMIYVVVEELIPDMSEGKHSNVATIPIFVAFRPYPLYTPVSNVFSNCVAFIGL